VARCCDRIITAALSLLNPLQEESTQDLLAFGVSTLEHCETQLPFALFAMCLQCVCNVQAHTRVPVQHVQTRKWCLTHLGVQAVLSWLLTTRLILCRAATRGAWPDRQLS
jgi:hypothetical protein